jgi:hypothetical protein
MSEPDLDALMRLIRPTEPTWTPPEGLSPYWRGLGVRHYPVAPDPGTDYRLVPDEAAADLALAAGEAPILFPHPIEYADNDNLSRLREQQWEPPFARYRPLRGGGYERIGEPPPSFSASGTREQLNALMRHLGLPPIAP